MIYLYNNKVYPHSSGLLEDNGMDMGSSVPTDAIVLKTIFPTPINEDWQYYSFDGGELDITNNTYTLTIKEYSMFAKLDDNNRVVDLTRSNTEGYIIVGDDVKQHISIGWIYVDGHFKHPLGNDALITEIKNNYSSIIKDTHEKLVLQFIGNPTKTEVATYSLQETCARAYINKTNTAHQLNVLTNLCKEGESVEDLAKKIVVNAEKYELLTSVAGGLLRNSNEMLKSVNSIRDFELFKLELSKQVENTINIMTNMMSV